MNTETIKPLGPAFDPRDATAARPATTMKISRSRAGHVWVTVKSVEFPEVVARELFADVLMARSAVRLLRADVEQRVIAFKAQA